MCACVASTDSRQFPALEAKRTQEVAGFGAEEVTGVAFTFLSAFDASLQIIVATGFVGGDKWSRGAAGQRMAAVQVALVAVLGTSKVGRRLQVRKLFCVAGRRIQ